PARGLTRPPSPTGESESSTEPPRSPPLVSRMTLPFQPGSRPVCPASSGRHKALLHGVSSPRFSYPGCPQLPALSQLPPGMRTAWHPSLPNLSAKCYATLGRFCKLRGRAFKQSFSTVVSWLPYALLSCRGTYAADHLQRRLNQSSKIVH